MPPKTTATLPPIGIIITHPKRFFKEYNLEKYLKSMERLNTEDNVCWYRVMKNLPRVEFLHIYTVYDGFVQHRTNFAGFVRGARLRFPRPEGGIRTFDNANAIRLCGPFEKAPVKIPVTGFQGFKYVYQNLW